jgi:hypothetical protein
MSEETGDPKYKQAAICATEHIWSNWGTASPNWPVSTTVMFGCVLGVFI